MKDSTVPDIRFGEFERTWKQATLGEYFEFKNGINADKEQYGSGIKFINVSDILNNDYLMYDLIEGSVDVPEDQIVKNEVKYGDVLFQRSSETRLEVGTANVYLDSVNRAVFGGFVIRGRGVREYSPKFMNYLLKTSASRKDITSRSGGSTRYNIGQESLSVSSINLPSLPEQQKIAAFLTAVDGRLAGLRRQQVALARYKRGVMQGVFSTSKKFQKIELEEISKWKSGGTPSKRVDDNWGGDIPWVSARAMHGGPYFTDSESRITQLAVDDGAKTTKADTILLLVRGSMLFNRIPVGIAGRMLAFNQDVKAISIDKEAATTEYVYYYLKAIENKLLSMVTGTGIGAGKLDTDQLKSLTINLPPLPEQRRIATFLRALDDRIGLMERQLAGGEAFKRGLVQKMFV